MTTKIPDASDEKVKEEGDWLARQFFSASDLQMSPEDMRPGTLTAGVVFLFISMTTAMRS